MKKQFKAPDISCMHCVKRIQSALESTGRIRDIDIDLETRVIRMETEMDAEEILAILEKAGYPAVEIQGP